MRSLLVNIFLLALAAGLAACGPSLEERKKSADIHYRMGVVHLNQGQLTESLKELTEAVETYPKEPSYFNALGLTYFARKMNTEAVEAFSRAIELDPKYSEARVNLSAVYLVEGDWDGVIHQSTEALKNVFYSTPEFAWYNMGRARYSKGDFTGAADSFAEAVEVAPAYTAAWYHLGLALERTGDLKKSLDAYQKALELEPGNPEYIYSTGVVYVKLKDNRRALDAFRRVLELEGDGELADSAREYIKLIR